MKKVVVKTKIRGRDDFEERLGRAGFDFGPIYWQHDRVYIPRGYRRGQNYPRFVLRTEMRAIDRPAKYYLILKRHIEDSGAEIEHVTAVKDYTEAVGIVMQLGFELFAEVSRKRQETRFRDGKVLFLDKIEGVNGYYAKIEKVIPEGEKVDIVKDEIARAFAEMGEQNFVQETYAEVLKNIRPVI